ncbi:class I SAM-dependent methyltransferase [Arenimonas terrae]|jgi:SAM-dependent methyltransferase|uniref:Class I SAM-dependent methyltransferase n=1 Tax=Arenimonas terrae TaxID=2546226 RepID=A0A5C4RW29_9GAMM|nr:class I SAM-dependent methyltransferase [Arenimonas terrae]TNJ35228.1 class I SAM-dependent methyltransferase [Arenimonas terrae]
MNKTYDRRYFDTWYRQRDLGGRAALARKVAMAVAVAEYHLGRPIRSVLDVGCGEGAWRAPLLALRPKLHYMGVDSSEYAIARHGLRRNLHWLPFGDLAALPPMRPVDLLVCSDVMHYLPDDELKRGLKEFARLCDGVAYLEVFAEGDDIVGDLVEMRRRPAVWYRRAFAKAGFTAAGSHLYLSEGVAAVTTALELP